MRGERGRKLDLGAWRSEEQRREAEGSFELEVTDAALCIFWK